MLVIRREQMAMFRNAREADFRRRLFEHLRHVVAASRLELSDDELGRHIDRGLASGRRFFSTERDLARYVETVLTRMGGWSDEDHPPPVLDLLAGRSLPGSRRLDSLNHWLLRAQRFPDR